MKSVLASRFVLSCLIGVVIVAGAASVGRGDIMLTSTGWSDPTVGTWDQVTLTGTLITDVTDSIRIYESGLTLDGDGYKVDVTVTGKAYGIDLRTNDPTGETTISNITVKNITVTGAVYGVHLQNVSGSTIEDCIISDNGKGFYIRKGSCNNTITRNVIASNDSYGAWLRDASNDNIVTDNSFVDNVADGVNLSTSNNNVITGNEFSGNSGTSIALGTSSFNLISGNTCIGNGGGIVAWSGSGNNEVTDNVFSDSPVGSGIYFTGSSNNNTFSNNKIEGNGGYGVYLHICYENNLVGNNISVNNFGGLWLYACLRNTIKENTVSNNTLGIVLDGPSIDNQVYNNNFIENTTQIALDGKATGNVFNLDKPTGGNYWSDWATPDADGDGFVDLPYSFSYGEDLLPLASPWTASVFVEIDIKPGSYPNTVNLGSHGLVPVAILSTVDFDATTVDADTIELAGASVAVRGKGTKLMAHKEDINGDSLIDLVVQVTTLNLDPDTFQDGYAILTGETLDGRSFEGSDEINIVPPQ